jgi:hypothetical protein
MVGICVDCSKTQNEPPTPAAPGSAAATASSSLANAAAKLTDPCPLLPMDMVKKLIPEATAPQSERYPLRCSVYGKEAALEIAFDTGPPPVATDGEPVTGIARGGILQRNSSKFPGDVYITLSLGNDDSGQNHNIHVEVNGQGKEHKEDALELARYVVGQLH